MDGQLNKRRMEIQKVGTLSGHQNPIFTVESGSEPAMLFTAGNDKGVVQWDMEALSFKRILLPVQSSVYKLYLIPGTSLLAVGERRGLVTIVDTITGEVVATLEHHQRPVFGIIAFADKPELVLSSEDGTVSVWDRRTYRLLYAFGVSEQTVRTIAISPDEQTVVFGTKDGQLKLYDANEYRLRAEMSAHTLPVTSLCYSPDGKYLLTGGRDAQLNVYNTSDFSLARTFTPHMFTVYAIAYHPVLPIVATGSRDKSIKIWSAEDFRLLRAISLEKGFDCHRLSINDITWNPLKNQLISVSDDKTAMVWDIGK